MHNNTRKIIHIDMDCFFAAIEMRDYPELASRPLAVGGAPDKRGVISTCNYAARKFGVHSAMASAHALKLCPSLVIQPVRMEIYCEESRHIHGIFSKYSNKIEPLSLDEAYLDVTDSPHHQGSATLIAQSIRDEIYNMRQLTASAGIGPNKSIAKIASDWHKPNGQMVVRPDEVLSFMDNLSVRKLCGVGPVMAARLATLCINTCGELRQFSKVQLVEHIGSMGERLYDLSRGIDHREVKVESVRKSISVEETYVMDLMDMAACLKEIPALIERLQARIEKAGELPPIHNIFVKLKFDDFQQTTVERLANKVDKQVIHDLIVSGWNRKKCPVRLLGLGVRLSQNKNENAAQLLLPGIL